MYRITPKMHKMMLLQMVPHNSPSNTLWSMGCKIMFCQLLKPFLFAVLVLRLHCVTFIMPLCGYCVHIFMKKPLWMH